MKTLNSIEAAKVYFENYQSRVFKVLTPNQALLVRRFEIAAEEELSELPDSVIRYTLRIAHLCDLAKSVLSLGSDIKDLEVLRLSEMDASRRMRLMEAYCTGLLAVGNLTTDMSPKNIENVFIYLRGVKDELVYVKYAYLFSLMIEAK